jgi:hypothetical protein
MDASVKGPRIFSTAFRIHSSSVIFRRSNLITIPAFTRSTTLRWSLLVAGIFAVFTVTLLGFVYLKAKHDLMMHSDRVIGLQMDVFTKMSPERRLDAIDLYLR